LYINLASLLRRVYGEKHELLNLIFMFKSRGNIIFVLCFIWSRSLTVFGIIQHVYRPTSYFMLWWWHFISEVLL